MLELLYLQNSVYDNFFRAAPALADWKIFYFLGAAVAIIVIYIASRYRLLDKKEGEGLENVRKRTLYRKKHEADLFEIKEAGQVSEYDVTAPAPDAAGGAVQKEKPDWETIAQSEEGPKTASPVKPAAAAPAEQKKNEAGAPAKPGEPTFEPAEPEKKTDKKAEDDYWSQIIKRKDGPTFKKF